MLGRMAISSKVRVELRTDSMLARLLKQFAAVGLGSLLYFFVLMPHLPAAAQHQPFRLDWGLLVVAWVCLVFYGLIERAFRRKR
jgi:hypothetical protein